MRAERIDGGLRGTGAFGKAADTIGHGEESGFGVAEKAVLIGATHSTNLGNGGGSDREEHGRSATDEWGLDGERCLTAAQDEIGKGRKRDSRDDLSMRVTSDRGKQSKNQRP